MWKIESQFQLQIRHFTQLENKNFQLMAFKASKITANTRQSDFAEAANALKGSNHAKTFSLRHTQWQDYEWIIYD